METTREKLHVQALVYPGFTTLDLIGALQPLAQVPWSTVEVVAKQPGAVPTDCGVPIVANKSFADADRSPDVLLVPGGGLPAIDALEDEETMTFLAEQGARAGWLVAVCTGTLLLGQAGLLRGCRAASHWGAIDTLDAFGATPVHERVVIDQNRCTGGGVTAGVDIGLAVVAAVAGEEIAKAIELVLEYNPAPPFGTGHPSLADPATLKAGSDRVAVNMPADRIRSIAARALKPDPASARTDSKGHGP